MIHIFFAKRLNIFFKSASVHLNGKMKGMFFFQHQYLKKKKTSKCIEAWSKVFVWKWNICSLSFTRYKTWNDMKNQYSLFSAGSHFKRLVLSAFLRKWFPIKISNFYEILFYPPLCNKVKIDAFLYVLQCRVQTRIALSRLYGSRH